MFAVISTGGKQYRVIKGQRLRVERLIAEVGDELRFDAMLIGGDEGSETRIGTAAAPVGQVRATVFDHGRAKKIEVIKFKRRKDYQRARFRIQAARNQEIWGRAGAGRQYPGPPARHPLSCRRQRWAGPRPHFVRHLRRHGEVRTQGAGQPPLRFGRFFLSPGRFAPLSHAGNEGLPLSPKALRFPSRQGAATSPRETARRGRRPD